MKTKIRDIVAISIFVSLFIAAVFVIRPLYKNLFSRIQKETSGVKILLEEKTGLSVSFKSLSPSILSGFSVRGVSLSDSHKTKVASIDKIKIEYKLLKLLRGQILDGIKSLQIDGVDVDLKDLISLISNFKSDEKKSSFNVSDFSAKIPFEVLVKNVNIFYQKENLDASMFIKKITTSYTARKNELSIDMNSSLSVLKEKLKVVSKVNFQASLFDSFENSKAMFTFSNFECGAVKLNRQSFLFNYKNNVISGGSVQNTFPLIIQAEYNLDSHEANASLQANDLSVSSILTGGKNSLSQKLRNVKIWSDTKASYSAEKKSLKYNSSSTINLPDSVVAGGLETKLAFSGNEKSVSVKNISLNGQNYDASGNLDLVFSNINLSGFLDIPKITLPNGNLITTEIYFDPLKKGFMAFSPQVFIGDKAFTAMQFSATPNNDSLDFSFEVSDYSHLDAYEPGQIILDGSYLFSSNYIQSSLALNSIYLDSMIETLAAFLNKDFSDILNAAAEKASDFVFTGDAYVSTDFSSISYNVPYILLANTQSENQAILLSFDGNESNVSVSQFDLIFGKIALNVVLSLDVMGNENFFFTADIKNSSIPYHFVGTYNSSHVHISGDYDCEFEMGFEKNNLMNGTLKLGYFPLPILDTSFVVSLNSTFNWSKDYGPEINILKFQIDEAGNKFESKPRVAFSGSVTKYGAQFPVITYSDIYSVLDGNASVAFSINDGIFGLLNTELKLKNSLSEESITFTANVTNPNNLPINLETVKKDLYFDLSLVANRFGLNRFTLINSDNNEISASVYASGTFENPYVSVSADNVAVMLSGDVLRGNASFLMENREISISQMQMNYRKFSVENVSGGFSLDNFSGSVFADVDGTVMGESVHLPLLLEVNAIEKQKNKFMPSSIEAKVSVNEISGTFIKKKTGFYVSAILSEEMISVLSSPNLGLYGYLTDSGDFTFNINSDEIAKIAMGGNYDKKTGELSGKISEIDVNVQKIFSYINMGKLINVYRGSLLGSVTISGTLDSPNLSGALSLQNPDFNLPFIIPDRLSADKVLVMVVNNEIDVVERIFRVKKNNYLAASCKIYFDKWKFDSLSAVLRTAKNDFVPIAFSPSFLSISGDANVDLNLNFSGKDLDVSGNIFAEKAEIFASLSKILAGNKSDDKNEEKVRSMYISCDLDFLLGTHVRMTLEPLIRCIFVPNGKLKFQYDQHTDQMILDGNLGLKSGDVAYLNRNFYVKEGSLKFSENDKSFNPRINVRAETRERDDKGDSVTIILTSEDQYISSFEPRFSSIPAKSETEIMALLGQIFTADSESVSDFLFAATDYLIQTSVGRKIEISLRDLLNFDIFSVRTNILQNTLNYSVASARNNMTGNLTAGNFFDNSTVYIGKYLGSALYVDAMVHLSYDNKRVDDLTTAGGLLFHPEFGLELASPFVNIRWSVAPDIDAMLHNQYVPATSVTLSWKFSF